MTHAFLLGAGASSDAHIPTTREMSIELLKRMTPWSEHWRFLRLVAGGVLFHAGIRGDNPLDGIDVEELFAAVQLLGRRHEIEGASFVAAWHPAIEALEQEFIHSKSVSEERRDAWQLGHVGERSMLPRYAEHREFGQEFSDLARTLLEELCYLTVIKNSKDVEYLAPLLPEKGGGAVTIATLNYDNAVEELAARYGCGLGTGIESWNETGSIAMAAEGVNLLKLHGSINWRLVQRQGVATGLVDWVIEEMPWEVFQHADREGSWIQYPWASVPGLVFGQGNKLRIDGPFIGLVSAMSQSLDGADRLVVVGYSFRDEHVNSVISRWLSRNARARITIVDPGFAHSKVPFAVALRNSLDGTRLEVIEAKAAEGLQEVTL